MPLKFVNICVKSKRLVSVTSDNLIRSGNLTRSVNFCGTGVSRHNKVLQQ